MLLRAAHHSLLLLLAAAPACTATAHAVTLAAPSRPEIDEFAGKGECERVSNCATGPTCCHRCYPNGDPCVWDSYDLVAGCTWVGRCCPQGAAAATPAGPDAAGATPAAPARDEGTAEPAKAPDPSIGGGNEVNATAPEPSNATESGASPANVLLAPRATN